MKTFAEWMEEREEVITEDMKSWFKNFLQQTKIYGSAATAVAGILGFAGLAAYSGATPDARAVLGIGAAPGVALYAAIQALQNYLKINPDEAPQVIAKIEQQANTGNKDAAKAVDMLAQFRQAPRG